MSKEVQSADTMGIAGLRLPDRAERDRRMEPVTSRPACESAWNKDPVFGVIGIQSGPRGQRVHSGFHDGDGSRFWDADSGDDCEDPAGLFRPGEADQGDLPRVSGIAESRTQGGSVAGDRVPVQARPPAAATDRSVAQTA